MKKIIRLILVTILTFISIFAFNACSIFNPDKFPNWPLNENKELQANYVQLSIEWDTPFVNGDFNKILLNVNIKGYSQLSYFNAHASITISATLITEEHPSGTTYTRTIDIPLDKYGCGSKTTSMPIPVSRAINNKNYTPKFSGSVTKIHESE